MHARKMHLAGHLMHEMALRRQDVVELTFNHFMNEKSLEHNSYFIEFYCSKQDTNRTVEISTRARDAVFAYRKELEEKGEKVNDGDQLFKYANSNVFSTLLK